MNIQELKKEKESPWDEFVNNHSEGRFVHLSNYKKIIEDTYGYRGNFLYAEENGEILAIFPFFQFKNILLKDKFSSQPFSEYGGILFKEESSGKKKEEILSSFNDYLKKFSNNRRNFYIEIHGQQDQSSFLEKYLTRVPLYKIAILKLDSFDNLYKNFDYQIKKAIKKAERENVRVYEETSDSAIKNKFYPLYGKYLKKRHGTPPYPLKFFLNCQKYAPHNIKIFFAEINNKIVASLWGFLTEKRAHITYNPSLEGYFAKRPNDLLHSEFIKWACREKIEYFDFGPARYPGQIRFKEKWGVAFQDYAYFYLSEKPIKIKPYTAESESVKIINFLWKYFMPISLANLLGPYLRKKMGK